MKDTRHIVVCVVALFVLLGLPAMYYGGHGGFSGAGTDATTGASAELPDRPSGDFVVLMDRAKHPDTLEAWTDFFSDRPTEVIMEDLSCLTLRGDPSGTRLAERYRARLAENQMTIRREDPTLVASRADRGLFDVIVLSKEMADAYQFESTLDDSRVAVISVKGAPE